MKTLTLKIPEKLEAPLTMVAEKRGLNKSEIVCRALIESFSDTKVNRSGTFLDLAQDLAGTINGSKDPSSNKDYFDNYGK